MQSRQRVLVTEVIPIPRPTVQGLLEVFRDAFRGPFKVERLRYSRGDAGVVVERLMPVEEGDPSSEFLTAYQMVKQHADLEIQEPADSPLESIAKAIQSLTSRRLKFTMFVAESRHAVRAWTGRDLRIEDIWQIPVVEDPEAHDRGIFVCGSSSGTMVQDIEAAVFCRME
jgi:hypothetical protein